MVVTKKFVFIHLHKSGGQFINKLLFKHFMDATEIGYHYPRSLLPAQFSTLPVFFFIRNPWDWYVSWYWFNKKTPLRNPVFRAVSDDGRNTFHKSISNMLRLGQDTPDSNAMRASIVARLPESIKGNRGSGITKACMLSFSSSDFGYYTWLVRRMVEVDGSMNGVVVGRTENLRNDLVSILQGFGVPVTTTLFNDIMREDRANALVRPPYQSCYDAALVDLVRECDSFIVDRFGYVF
jgi:hypothetical protein